VRRISGGTTGGPFDTTEPPAGDASPLIRAVSRGRDLRPVQSDAFSRLRILGSRRNLVVCAPTNSGKSMVGYALLLAALQLGRRAVLLEPLRALAQEQAESLRELAESLPDSLFPVQPSIILSTGDYRLEDEVFSAPPPSTGEIIVATPERFDTILRNPENDAWVDSIGTVVVDEAHLLSDLRRGPTLETVVATMLSRPAPPRLALLSATMGAPERLQEWLAPCDLVQSSARTPLRKEVWALETEENADKVLVDEVIRILEEPAYAAIVFVYRRADAEAVAKRLAVKTSERVDFYHSAQSVADRARVRAAFQSGECRCIVSTTALALGVNLPASHVILRDSTFHGEGRLSVSQLLQILGRAGRGDRSGLGAAIVRAKDAWQPDELADALRKETLPSLTSSFERALGRRGKAKDEGTHVREASALGGVIASALSRAGGDGLAEEQVSSFLRHTLSGATLAIRTGEGLRWLIEPSRSLAYRGDDQKYRLTALGTVGVRASLPLDYVAGLGQLVRDLLSLGASGSLLKQWCRLDHLLVMALLSDRAPSFRRFSEDLADRIDGFVESCPSDEKSLLFRNWILGSAAASKADELFGSLGLGIAGSVHSDRSAVRKSGYVAMLAAVVLNERSLGTSRDDLERRWSVTLQEGAEESWRDTSLWLLSGHSQIFDVRCFYHHLKVADATHEQVLAVKSAFRRMRHQSYELMERIKYCSPLGPLLRGVRSIRGTARRPRVGVRTIATLEAAGVRTMKEVGKLDIQQLVALGVQERFAAQIQSYVRRRQK
jgi:helicase